MTNSTVNDLNQLLADFQVLYQKLRNYHWNVRGPQFFELHAKFEEMYTEAALQVDELAERVLALGGHPLSTLSAQLGQARLEEDADRPEAQQMVRNLLDDLDRLGSWLREAVERSEDVATRNLLEGMADAQEKTAWMLRASLG